MQAEQIYIYIYIYGMNKLQTICNARIQSEGPLQSEVFSCLSENCNFFPLDAGCYGYQINNVPSY